CPLCLRMERLPRATCPIISPALLGDNGYTCFFRSRASSISMNAGEDPSARGGHDGSCASSRADGAASSPGCVYCLWVPMGTEEWGFGGWALAHAVPYRSTTTAWAPSPSCSCSPHV